ncbi:MAG: epoxide hydrolase N-terminal domain-containing protein, partial [Sphingomicrobium sp.]
MTSETTLTAAASPAPTLDAPVIGATAATVQPAVDTSIRPFQFHASDAQLAALKRRILATRWPERETVSDSSQGVPLATMQELARYWARDYDWRKVQAKLDSYPQFVT